MTSDPVGDGLTFETMGQHGDSTRAGGARKGSEMASTLGDPPLPTDSNVDALAWQFLNSAYADNDKYADWPLDRRLEGFLRRQGLVRLAEDGDANDLILNRVLSYIGSSSPSAGEIAVR
jgi:hypothetical protein